MKTKILIFSILLCICNFQISAQLNDTIIGDAENLGGNCFLITPEAGHNAGGIWYDNPIDFSNDFTIYYQNNFGDRDSNGADGMALVFKTTSDAAIGSTGEGIGYSGINNSLIVEFDTYQNGNQGDPFYDHLAITKNGNPSHNSADNLAGPVQASSSSANIEDGIFHEVKVQWDATAQVLSVFFDCELRLTLTEDIKNTVFNGDSSIFFGFVGSTGGAINRQEVCFNSISFVENLVVPENQNICLGQEINIDATIPSGNSYSWSPTIGVSDAEIANPDFSPTETTDYTVTITDNCGELTNYTVTITVSSISTPTFAQIAAICIGENLPDLPTTSANGISGTWLPEINNTATTLYTFTPDTGECSTDLAEMTVIVNPIITPTFTQVAAIFSGETLAALPTTSNNNITGTWSPAVNNTETTTYTFLPDASEACAINQTMIITVTQSACAGSSGNQLVNPSFEVPSVTNIGNNILTWPINGWNGVGSAPNFVKVNGVAGQGGPVSAQEGVQYLDIAGGSADFYQEFDFQCNTRVFFSGYFSVRDGQTSTGRIDILRVNSDNTTDVVAFSNQLNMPSTANIWYLASGDAVLPAGTYRFNISMGNNSNFDSACFSFDNPNVDAGSYDPLCESSSITLTGTPTDSFGSWTGSGIVDNGDGTASFNPSGLGGTAVTVTYSHFNASGFGCSQSTNITVNPLITPTFTQVDPIFSGETLAALPTTSNNNITGTWSPAINNTETTNYTFTSDASEACAINQTMTITVNPIPFTVTVNSEIICSSGIATMVATPSPVGSYSYTWIVPEGVDNPGNVQSFSTSIEGDYSVSISKDNYLCNTDFEENQIVESGNYTTVNQDSVPCWETTASDSQIEVWGDGFMGFDAYSGNQFIELNANMRSTLFQDFEIIPGSSSVISFAHRGRNSSADDVMEVEIGPIGGPYTNLGSFSDGTDAWGYYSFEYVFPDDLGISYTIRFKSVIPASPTSVGNFLDAISVVFPSGVSSEIATGNVSIITDVIPTFTQVAAICNGEALAVLPTTSNNGVTGTWSPAMDNTATTIYTFAPDTTQPDQACAINETMTITVNPIITPTFTQVDPICNGDILALPTTSNNGVTGTWSPAMNNTATTNYTFTPDAGQCAITSSIDIVVNPIITPSFSVVNAICSGDTLPNLPSISSNSITGTWSPAMNNTATTNYTFTPDAGQCATTSSIDIVVNPTITPFFNAVSPIRSGDTLSNLPSTSNNGIRGTWSPAMNNTATTNYTFTPTPGQCAVTSTIEIVVFQPYNAFSPNEDGVNDTFVIPILFNYLDFEIEVFNRWGTKVYYYNNNGSTSPSWWDGYATVGLLHSNSKPLTVGTYYYIIHLNNKVKDKITGWIYLNR